MHRFTDVHHSCRDTRRRSQLLSEPNMDTCSTAGSGIHRVWMPGSAMLSAACGGDGLAEPDRGWRRCSACKKPIGFGETYWTCSVSSCNRARTALFFCSVSCWEVHLPVARHREAWAEEQTAPRESEAAAEASAAAPRKRRRLIRAGQKPARTGAGSSGAGSPSGVPSGVPREVLVIASRLKEYIRATSGFSTSDRVLEPLSEIVRDVCDRAARNAAAEGRKTVLDRDVPSR